jgi:predicted nucleotidyltransferase
VGRDDVLAILRAHREDLDGYEVESLRLFGSMARGDSSANSDVDLLVRFRRTPSFSGFMRLRIFLEDLLGLKVDLVTESGLREEVRPFVEGDAIHVT